MPSVRERIECVNCGESFERESCIHSDVDNEWYCRNCHDETFSECDGCGRICFHDDLEYIDNDDASYCSECLDNRDNNDEDGELYIPHKEKATALVDTDNLSKSDSFNVFGCEIESIVDEEFNIDDYPVLRYFKIVDDGSLSKNGVEFVSMPLPNTKLGMSVLSDFQKKFAKEHLHIDKSCGLHLHIFIHNEMVNVENLKKILLGYKKMENVFFNYVPSSRRNNHYCQNLGQFEEAKFLPKRNLLTFLSYWYKRRIRDYKFIPKEKMNATRYYWLNLNSVFFRNTIEIRLLNGTYNSRRIMKWYEIHRKFLNWLVATPLIKVKRLDRRMFLYDVLDSKLRRTFFQREGKFTEEGHPLIEAMSNFNVMFNGHENLTSIGTYCQNINMRRRWRLF